MECNNSYMGRASFYSLSSSISTQMENPMEEFEEEEIWAVVPSEPNTKDLRFKSQKIKKVGEIASTSRRLPTTLRMIPQSLANEDSVNNVSRIRHQSAPVNIPDWSRVQRRESQRRITPIDDEFGIDEDDGEEEDKEDKKIPSHELIARQLARSQITSFFVFEGAGRTLKGREFQFMIN